MKHSAFVIALVLLTTMTASGSQKQWDIMPVWAGHPVGFSLLTHGSRQFVAFYDAQRRMTLGVRTRDAEDWQFAILPENVGWDSHNYVTMAIDRGGYLHVSGNMHGDPLVYFRSRKPFDIHSMERIESMVGERERRVTYPRFIHGPQGQLIFTYRDGGSGAGDQLFNVYDVKTQAWSRLFDEPLTSGEGKMNAYFHGPRLGPDGYFHMVWVWRDTGDCATNHSLSYARTKDLVVWEKSNGEVLELPITLDKTEVVDPVPPGGGLLNGNTVLGWDSQGRTVISYHKYDENGYTQLYNARLENGEWKFYRTSDWTYRWGFSGGGSIIWEIGFSGVRAGGGRLTQQYKHIEEGTGTWVLDEKTLRPIETLSQATIGTTEERVDPSFAGATQRSTSDLGSSGLDGVQYVLRWETLDTNRDRPREGEPPPPSMLRIHKIVRSSGK